MATLSHKKVSILGLILLAASAITAAVVPKGKTDKKTVGYSLSMSECGNCYNDQLTCSSTDNPVYECNYTGDSTNNTSKDFDTSYTTNCINKTATRHTPNSLVSTVTGENTSASPC